MKDTTFTARQKKKELIALLVCFIIANLANLYAIVTYNGRAIEMLTSMGYVAVAALVLYALWVAVRIAFCGIKGLKKRK